MGTTIPENAQTIYAFLTQHGANANAAAGILGNIAQESGGSPSAGVWPYNYGLIQWTPASNYFSSPPSLAQQLHGIIAYIERNGGMGAINQNASSPASAALYFSQKYERPNPQLANNENRQHVANLVAEAQKNGTLSAAPNSDPVSSSTGDVTTPSSGGSPATSGYGSVYDSIYAQSASLLGDPTTDPADTTSSGSGAVNAGDVTASFNPVSGVKDVAKALSSLGTFFEKILWIFNPTNAVKFALYVFGGVAVVGGLAMITFGAGTESGDNG